MKANLKVIRDTYTDKSTIGRLYINNVFFCDTLEDTIRLEKIKGITAIPAGTYKMILNISNRFKKLMPLLIDVPNYQGVRIHSGNTSEDTKGCILVGLSRTINNIGQSRDAFTKLMAELDKYKEFEINIIDKKQ